MSGSPYPCQPYSSRLDAVDAALSVVGNSFQPGFSNNVNGLQRFQALANGGDGYATFDFRSEHTPSSSPEVSVRANADEGFNVQHGSSFLSATRNAVSMQRGGRFLQLNDSGFLVSDPANFRTAINGASLVDNNFTGLQQFSGTNTPGLQLKSLTDAQITALAAASALPNGSILVSSTTNRARIRLNGVTEEVLTTAGGQTIGGTLTVNGNLNAASAFFQLSNRILMTATNSSILRITDAAAAAGFSIDCATDGTMVLRNRTNTAAGNLNAGNVSVGSGYIEAQLLVGTGNTGYACHSSLGVQVASSQRFGITSGANPQVTPDVQFTRNPTGPAWVSRAEGGFQSRNLDNTADRPISGSNITASGTVTVGSNPTTALQVAPKQYTDAIALTAPRYAIRIRGNDTSLLQTAVTGAGVAAASGVGRSLTSGTTSGAARHAWNNGGINNNGFTFHEIAGKDFRVIPWGQSIEISFRVSIQEWSATTSGYAYLFFGVAQQIGATLTQRGVGVSIDNARAIRLMAHNGTTLTTSSSLGTASIFAGGFETYRINSNGAGTVSLFRDSVFLGSISGGPTTDGAQNVCGLHVEIGNGGQALTNTMTTGDMTIAVAPTGY